MSGETSNDCTIPSGAELSDLPVDEEESGMDEECSDPEPEGLTFYHMDLYESRDRLEIFPNEQFIKAGRGEDVAEITESKEAREKWPTSAEQTQQDLQKEVEELARLYGLDEDREMEEEFIEFHAPTTEKVLSEHLPQQTYYVEAEELMHQTEEQDKEEFAEQSNREENEDPHNKDIVNDVHIDDHIDEEPHKEDISNDVHIDDHSDEEPHKEDIGNDVHIDEHIDEEFHKEDIVNEVHIDEHIDEEPHKEDIGNDVHTDEHIDEEPHNEDICNDVHIDEHIDEDPHKGDIGNDVRTDEHIDEEPHKEDIVNDVHTDEHIDEEPASDTAHQEKDEEAIDDQALEDDQEVQPEEEAESIAENDVPDIFCVTCKTPIRAFEKLFGIHKEHQVTQLANAVEDVKDEIHKNMCKLEEQIAQMENFASHLEEIFITVEENFGRQEQNFEMHYSEIMQTLAQRYDEKTQALEEEKKQKLEALYGQLVDCGKNLDTSKDLMETIQELFKGKEKAAFVKTAVDTTDRLEEFLKAGVHFETVTYPDYENKTIDFSDVQQLLDSINTVPAPSAPVINPQAPNSATGTSVKVCWSLFSDDTVESYQLYYKPVSDETPSEEQAEFVLNVKETYCTVENLAPNTQYEFWVTALNTTGIGPASERAVYVTAPSPPVIKYKQYTSCENAAFICWDSGENLNPVDSYTVELCKVTNEENGNCIAESIVGIPTCESLIQLQPGETYDIYVRAANVGGPSERSKPATVHTTGTFFHLNDSTAHPLLSILDDGFTISCDEEESLGDLQYHYNSFTRCIAVMGNLIPVKGKHYWEVEVEESTEYRIGVAFEDTNRNGYIGANNTSWCMRHVITPSRHKYEFLHCGTTPDVRITIPPQRIGILLDYENWKLSFFNMELFQHLYTFDCHFQHLVHPCFALEKPGTLRIRNGIAIPKCVILS